MASWTLKSGNKKLTALWAGLSPRRRNEIRQFLEYASRTPNEIPKGAIPHPRFAQEQGRNVVVAMVGRYAITMSITRAGIEVLSLQAIRLPQRHLELQAAVGFSNPRGSSRSAGAGLSYFSQPLTSFEPFGFPFARSRNFAADGTLEEAKQLFRAAGNLAEELGFEIVSNGPLTHGSWWQDVKLKTKDLFSKQDVRVRADAVEDVLFGHANINVDEKIVDMTAKLITALAQGGSSAAVVDSGLFLFIKTPDGDGGFHIYSKRLTVTDRATLNYDPTIVQSPSEVLHRLKDAKRVSRDRLAEIQSALCPNDPLICTSQSPRL